MKIKMHRGDVFFEKCCELAGVEPTHRQYRKFARGFGSANKFRRQAAEAIRS